MTRGRLTLAKAREERRRELVDLLIGRSNVGPHPGACVCRSQSCCGDAPAMDATATEMSSGKSGWSGKEEPLDPQSSRFSCCLTDKRGDQKEKKEGTRGAQSLVARQNRRRRRRRLARDTRTEGSRVHPAFLFVFKRREDSIWSLESGSAAKVARNACPCDVRAREDLPATAPALLLPSSGSRLPPPTCTPL